MNYPEFVSNFALSKPVFQNSVMRMKDNFILMNQTIADPDSFGWAFRTYLPRYYYQNYEINTGDIKITDYPIEIVRVLYHFSQIMQNIQEQYIFSVN